MDYLDFSAHPGAQDVVDDLAAAGVAHPVQHYNAHLAAAYSQDPSKAAYLNHNFPAQISCEIKPRLTKEQHDILEAHFQKQNKPNTNTKKTFAEALNVSLDKVNNWFQNRRAKLKQDAKKQQGSVNLYHGNPQSDSETSPVFVDPTSQYHALMQSWAAEQRAPNGLGISQLQGRDGLSPQGASFPAQQNASLATFGGMQFHQDMTSSQEELNRRTLTQEQFDAMERSGGMMNHLGTFENFGATFNGNQEIMSAVFPDYGAGFKQQSMPNYPLGAPMTSYDSTVPSNMSVESLPNFPSSAQMQPYADVSASSSEWSDSRSSSLHEGSVTHVPTQHQPMPSSAQWQPGQSIPVDATQQQEEFRQVAARANQARTSPQQSMHEQAMSWNAEALVRRGSSASLIQSMGRVGIETPPQPQPGTFKSPAPPSNIAARRQRAPRPAALGVAALRSQSHSGAVQPGSPNHVQQQFNPADHPLRRIRSSNFLGNVAQGRVMKSTPGSAQRSPLNFTFADAMNSPQAFRHVSTGTLAPPTPLSPNEPSGMDEASQMQALWAHPFANASRTSIAETEAEHMPSHIYHPNAGMPLQSWTSSPPHTPMYPQHSFLPTRLSGPVKMENTPPQSAPASQTCFPSTVFAMSHAPPQPQPQLHRVPSQPVMQQQVVVPVAQPPQPAQHFVNPAVAEQQLQMPNMGFVASSQPVGVPSTPGAHGLPIHFANGVPMTNGEGNIEMMFPSATHFVQPSSLPSHGNTPSSHAQTPPRVTYPFVASGTGSPSSQPSSSLSKSSSTDFFVHEYSPPDSVKRSDTPRRGTGDTPGPKSYAFANTGPEHFEDRKSGDEKKGMKIGKDSSSSPASSNGTLLTSSS